MKFFTEHNGQVLLLSSLSTYWVKDGKVHRDGEPAMFLTVGGERILYWEQNGNYHREDGPAIIYGGIKSYWLDGASFSEENYKKRLRELRDGI